VSAAPETLESIRAERDHYRQRLVAMPATNLIFHSEEAMNAWVAWRKATFDAQGEPLPPTTPATPS
jgi:hypothetical protein